VLALAATALGVGTYRQKLITQVENIDSLTAVSEAQLLSNQQLESLTTSVKAGKQFKQINNLGKALVGQENWQETKYKTTATLQQSIYGTQELNRIEGHSQQVNAISISDNGKIYATASDDGTVKVWQANGNLLKTLTSEQAQIQSISFRLDGSEQQIINPLYLTQKTSKSTKDSIYVISTNDDSIVQLRAKSNQQLISSYSHPESVNHLSLSPDKKLLATTTIDGKIYIWNKEGILQQTLTGHTGEILDIQFLPHKTNSDRYKLISTGVDKTVKIWQVFTRDRNQAEEIYSIAISPKNPDTFAAAIGDANGDSKIKIWRNNHDNTQKLIHTLLGHQATISQIKYSPDGKIIASASWDQTIKLWNAQTGELINTLKGYQDGINSIVFSPDSQTLISTGEDKTIKIWNLVGQAKLIKTFTGHTDSIKTVTVSPNSELIASAGYDNTIKLWTIKGDLLQTIKAHNLAITSLAFTPDSKISASGSWDNTVKIWSIKNAGKSSELLHTLTGHQDGVTTVSFNSDGTVLATGSGDRTIKLWNPETGELIKTLRGHTSQINSLAFSSDDQSIISGESQQGLFWWNLDLDDLLNRGCDRLTDYLTTNPNVKPNEQSLCR
jgi:WD40 repeat protein